MKKENGSRLKTIVLVLAGGQSRRMGRDKLSLPWQEPTSGSGVGHGQSTRDATNGAEVVKRFMVAPPSGENVREAVRHTAQSGTILEHVVQVCLHVAEEVRVLVPPTAEPPTAISGLAERTGNLQLVPDEKFYDGPLAALAHAWPTSEELEDNGIIYVVAGDLPGLAEQVLTACAARLEQAPRDTQAVLVAREGTEQPLLGCYRWSAGETLKAAASADNRRLLKVVQTLSLQIMDSDDLGWPEWWTRPVHTPEDYELWLHYQAGI